MKKEDFVVGNWYKHSDYYLKFKEFIGDNFYYSEYIYNKTWGGMKSWRRKVIGSGFVFSEINILEIQSYLPPNHPDLIITNVIDTNQESLLTILNQLNIK
tara:strand:+ start:921 stop:1220 length:300 start_codon:yes stop_codon:yes gene_type:complete